MIVNVFGIRHGQKNPDGRDMNDFGEEQVVASARKHFSYIRFHLAVHSGMSRAARTVELVLQNSEYTNQPRPYAHPLFDFRTYAGPTSADEARAFEAAHEGKNMTVAQAMELWPSAAASRERFIAGLHAFVRDITALHMEGDVNVLMGGHSLFSDLAVPHPETFPRLQFADIVRYGFLVQGANVEMTSATFYGCPLRAA